MYSVSPKSYLRRPTRKRNSNKKTLLLSGGLACLVLVVLAVALGIYSYMHSRLVSPLPIKIGERIQITSTDRGEQELKRLLKLANIMYTSVTPAQDGYTISLNQKQQVFVTKQKDIASQISSLQVILPRLTMEGREFHRLDLRYDKPVVVYGD